MQALLQTLQAQTGSFTCRLAGDPPEEKTVPFRHLVLPPVQAEPPPIGRLPEFYAACGGLALFDVPSSEEAARRLLPPPAWPELDAECAGWFEGLSAQEWQEYVPEPLLRRDAQGRFELDALVIGDTPHAGNYILMAASGEQAGQVYEFDHDGFEFRWVAPDIVAYVRHCLAVDGPRLLDYASHLCFVEGGDGSRQWFIRQMRVTGGAVIELE